MLKSTKKCSLGSTRRTLYEVRDKVQGVATESSVKILKRSKVVPQRTFHQTKGPLKRLRVCQGVSQTIGLLGSFRTLPFSRLSRRPRKGGIYPEEVCGYGFCLLNLTARSYTGDSQSSQKKYRQKHHQLGLRGKRQHAKRRDCPLNH